ncbi:MAG: CotH kinase family protein [Candidatus Hermodarchaeota archaeon]
MLEITTFQNKIKTNKPRKRFTVFSISAIIIFSTIGFYTYVKNSPIGASNLPIIRITTEDNPNYENNINCNFQLESKNGLNSEVIVKSQIKIRGSGTGWNKFSPKKGYRIELSQPQSLLGMRKDDDWLLISMYSDFPRMKIKMAFDVYRSLSSTDPLTILPRSRYVLLYLNGEFQGLYLLAERIDRRLFGLDDAQDNLNSSLIFQTKFNTDLTCYDDEAWEQDWPNDYEGISIMEDILIDLTDFISNSKDDDFFHSTTGIYSKFNKLNLIDFFLYNFFIQHKDFWSKNYYLIRNTNPANFSFIPWDFDECFGQFAWKRYSADENPEMEIRSKNELYRRLIENTEFMRESKSRWFELRESLWTEDFFSEMISEFYDEIKNILEFDTNLWNPGNYDKEWNNDVYEYIEYLDQWIIERLDFCDNYFNQF